MKNLTPLTRKIYYWDKIVNAMHLRNRNALQAIRPTIERRFREYGHFSTPNVLGRIPASTFVEPTVTSLKTCYDSGSNGIGLLKQKIRDCQPELFKGECQYCNMGEPSTMDHYLPQLYFPEFSALSINLIPCCPTCNTEKGDQYLFLGNRRIINYYFDDLPIVDYLLCNITFRRGVAKANFSLDTTAVVGDIATVIENHFKALDLLERYRERSGGEIIEVMDAITQRVGAKSLHEMRTELLGDAIALKNRKGVNYWRAVLKTSLANSDQFLESVGFH
ncbi:hypothetical protein [Chryseobacterium indoltheticum]|nr:hypothetical protein [Chryseobacterium indoltheticum]